MEQKVLSKNEGRRGRNSLAYRVYWSSTILSLSKFCLEEGKWPEIPYSIDVIY